MKNSKLLCASCCRYIDAPLTDVGLLETEFIPDYVKVQQEGCPFCGSHRIERKEDEE